MAIIQLVLALIILGYDAGTAGNSFLNSEEDSMVMIGMGISLAVTVIMFVMQINVLKKLKKNAEDYSRMVFDEA